MSTAEELKIINEAAIAQVLEEQKTPDAARVREILAKASELGGLSMPEVAALMAVEDPELLNEIFDTARQVKHRIYGARLVLFAPLYVSSHCGNDCLYCAFRAPNTDLVRKALTQEEIAEETLILINQGHKRVLLVAGEAWPHQEGFGYLLKCIETVYATKKANGEIRRLNVNVAPLEVDQFRELKAANIGTYQLFQETYHRETYKKVHVAGRKSDYDWRLTCMDRAMQAGIDDVGIGVLFGLYDWRFEVLAMMQHAEHLESRYGAGPHTISVPRLEPAMGAPMAENMPAAVSDDAFRKLIAVLRLAVPYTGMVLSTRESPEIRRESFALGISQISAGSRTNPGGYAEGQAEGDRCASQFQLGDHRSLDEVIRDVAELGYIPSFCTACYRLGRTGADFMDLAKPGEIRNHCDPNALSTFAEYLEDYGSPETRAAGNQRIDAILNSMEGGQRQRAQRLVEAVRNGRRDMYV